MEDEQKKIFQGFTLLTHCGGGAFGDVWYAQDISGKKLALKIIHKKRLGDQWKKELNGVRNYRKITEEHPELLQIYHVGEDDETFFYTMEPADNAGSGEYKPDTLAGRLQKGALSSVEITGVLTELLLEIKAIHESGFTHRDIKPDNILFVKGKPKLADIGLMSSLSVTMTQLAGTLDFLPPEQLTNGSSYDKKSRREGDLYAFGKVIYCMVTGNNPGKFPSIPGDMTKSLERKYYFRLALRLCDHDHSRRIVDFSALTKEMEIICRVIEFGETRLGRIKFFLEHYCICLRNKWFQGENRRRKKIWMWGIFASLTAFICFILFFFREEQKVMAPGDGADADKNPGKDTSNQNGNQTEVEQFLDQVKSQEERNEKNPEGIQPYDFGNGKYTLFIPNSWGKIDRKGIVAMYRNKKGESLQSIQRQLKQMRQVWGIFHMKNEKGEPLHARIILSTLSYTPEEIKSFTDGQLKEMLGKYLHSVLINRYDSFRSLGSVIMLIGTQENGEKITICLLPRKTHCIQVILVQDPRATMNTYSNFIVLLESLKENPKTVYQQEPEGRTPLMLALWNRDYTAAEKMLREGADINETAYGGSTALHLATEENCLETVKFLLDRNANPNLPDVLKMTPVHIAARDGNAEILAELLKRNGRLDCLDFRELTPLCYAVENSRQSCVQVLLKNGANPNVSCDRHFKTPLIMKAIAQREPEILKILIKGGINIQAVNQLGENALLRALDAVLVLNRPEKITFAEILINSGINVNQQNQHGETALMYAARLGNESLFKLLLSKGADPGLKDKKGRTVESYIDIKKNPGMKKLINSL